MNMGAPKEIVYSTLAVLVLVVSSVLIPFFKSSAHMAGIAGFTGLYLALFEKYNAGNLSTMLVLVGFVVPWLGHAQLLNAILSENYLAVAFCFLAYTSFFLGKIRLLILLVLAEFYVDIYATENVQEEQPMKTSFVSLF